MGVGITWSGVVGEVHAALAAIDLNLQHGEEVAVAIPTPVEEDLTTEDSDFELGLDGLDAPSASWSRAKIRMHRNGCVSSGADRWECLLMITRLCRICEMHKLQNLLTNGPML